jgi:hypothetical protein
MDAIRSNSELDMEEYHVDSDRKLHGNYIEFTLI